ncbi:E3 SUMO-protein ligase ZBED1-like [Macrosteles quadrilineatus]|uniref:E3 SUMO-protein ligase ZBED1-like n=1 Tax=Macrosteles quadrilineatus TaxID=74068 RepID=UPI0023E1FDF7|nr:E3 SUMO-protein ligase ZBED1-like [Macrosteles quadrilineatus]
MSEDEDDPGLPNLEAQGSRPTVGSAETQDGGSTSGTSGLLFNIKNKTPIWKYFHKDDKDSSKAICNICQARIGIKTGSTTSLQRHLIAKHKNQADNFKKEQSKKDELSKQKKTKKDDKKQQTLGQCLDMQTTWPSDHPKAKSLTNKIGIWMAKNLHPYSLVEEEGLVDVLKEASPKYKLPSRNTFSRRVIPELYETTRLNISKEIENDLTNVMSLSFTADLWTSRSNDPFIAVTLHYVSNEFKMKRFCLGNEYLPGEHDGPKLAEKIKQIAAEWGIQDDTVPIFSVTDNAANMVAAMRLLPWTHITCFAHTLQLALKDAKKNTTGMMSMLSAARSIVGHYKRSSSAQQRLHSYQKNLGKKEVELVQDCETRWNSEYQMLSRLVQQKEAISGELISSRSNINNLSMTEWKMAEEYIDILCPLDEATTKASASKLPTMSMVYPLVSTIEDILEKRLREKKPGATFCRNLLLSMKTRFSHVKSDNLYKACMAVDPHFKCVLLKPHEKSLLKDRFVSEAISSYEKQTKTTEVQQSQTPEIDKPGSSNVTDFWKNFEILASSQSSSTVVEETETAMDHSLCLSELDVFFNGPRISPQEDTLEWWKNNQHKYHYIAPLARKYLGIPATEVESERVFSSAGNVVNVRRESLTVEHVKELVFLHQNLK